MAAAARRIRIVQSAERVPFFVARKAHVDQALHYGSEQQKIYFPTSTRVNERVNEQISAAERTSQASSTDE